LVGGRQIIIVIPVLKIKVVVFYSSSAQLAMQSAVLAIIDSVCPSVCHTLISCQNDSS